MYFRLSKTFLPAFFVLLLSYFLYHAYHGDRGMYSKQTLTRELAEAEGRLENLKEIRKNLQNKAERLGGNKRIDKDLLTEKMRDLGYVAPDEIMLIEPGEN